MPRSAKARDRMILTGALRSQRRTGALHNFLQLTFFRGLLSWQRSTPDCPRRVEASLLFVGIFGRLYRKLVVASAGRPSRYWDDQCNRQRYRRCDIAAPRRATFSRWRRMG